jgi:hypothetical protein
MKGKVTQGERKINYNTGLLTVMIVAALFTHGPCLLLDLHIAFEDAYLNRYMMYFQVQNVCMCNMFSLQFIEITVI